MLLSRLSVSSRFLLVLTIGFIFQAVISIVSLVNMKEQLILDRTAEVKHLLETAYSAVAFYHDQAAKGLMTDAAAREAARNVVRAMHYDDNNYYFIWTLDGTGVAHGSHREWEGMTMLNSADAARYPVVSYMVARLIEVARSDRKEGVTTYQIPKFGQTVPLDKIAYTRLFEPWGWSIGTGAYLDDIDAAFRKLAFSVLSVFIGLIALASLMTFAIGRNLARALNRLSARVASVAKGEFDGDVPEIARHDEVGVMARALLVLRDNSRDAVELRLDQLTGLPNRKLLMDRFRQATSASSRIGSYGGLMLIDLDKFKALNDTHGHDLGDMLLREVAKRLTSCVRDGDTVARLGGDEFVVLALNLGPSEEEAASTAEVVGERILAALNQAYYLGSVIHVCSASVGITLFGGDLSSAEEVLKQADMVMYKSKEAGRNSCCFFDPDMEATVHERVAAEAELRQAIAEKQFLLHYQPQVGADGSIRGVEALIRWNHPRRGLVPPVEFIPLAEKTGLILPIGQWVLETACQQLAAWAARPGMTHLKIAVNVSARQFQRHLFSEQVEAILQSTAADPNRLELELTESLLVENIQDVVAKMFALKAMGVGFTLDDFGTGYSSLAYLKLLPLDQLKIDRSFVRDVLIDPNDAAIARTIVALAHTLGLDVIAEGVETDEQLEFLASAGCRSYQGYYFSRPLPLLEFERFALQSRHFSLLE